MNIFLNVTVVGLGYVGLVTAAGLAQVGHRVRGIDVDSRRIALLERGTLPFHEPGLDELVAANVADGRLTLEPDLQAAAAGADVIFVAVGTHDGNGGWQTDSILASLLAIARHAPPGSVVAVRSTLPPDSLDRLAARTRKARQAEQPGADLPLVLNPEFTREGTAVRDFLAPDRIVVGGLDDPTGRGTAVLRELYRSFEAPILAVSGHDACLTKLGSNLFLATKISFANELARLCDRYGARVDDVVEGMSYDRRIGGSFLRPGVGFGGSCLPHQVAMTIRSFREDGDDLPLLASVDHINEHQRTRFVDLLDRLVGGLAGRHVALLGLTFKPGTDDLRDAPSLPIARALLDRGAAVSAADPMPAARRRAAEIVPGLRGVDDAMDALVDADAVGLVTEWPEFRALDWSAAAVVLRGRVVVDGRNALEPDRVTAAGLRYAAFGRGLSEPAEAPAPVAVEAPAPEPGPARARPAVSKRGVARELMPKRLRRAV
ncbi:MAG: nucleotide sugar dehydrogenase [Chloroflexi bacterium]|nr:nucleotide sugar dehydrogenase [Chloroflexota bacterium]